MSAMTYAGLLVGLFSAVGAGIVVAVGKTPKLLRDEIAQRVQESIAVIDGCKDRPLR
jgi:hypothetical protein